MSDLQAASADLARWTRVRKAAPPHEVFRQPDRKPLGPLPLPEGPFLLREQPKYQGGKKCQEWQPHSGRSVREHTQEVRAPGPGGRTRPIRADSRQWELAASENQRIRYRPDSRFAKSARMSRVWRLSKRARC